MKKFLQILLGIDIISLIISVVALIFSGQLILALLTIPLGLLSLVPIIALIECIDNIDALSAELSSVRGRLYILEKQLSKDETDDEGNKIPAVNHGEKARETWKCVKCDTVNKAGSDCCDGCGAPFYPEINPTYSPDPKATSRFVKFKKKK